MTMPPVAAKQKADILFDGVFMKITEQIVRLDCTKGSYAYAILGQSVTLIDTSYPGRGGKILSELALHSAGPERIGRILLTHKDADHIGNAIFLQAATGCDIYIGENDLPSVSGAAREKGLKGMLNRIMCSGRLEKAKTLPAGPIAGVEIIPAPGHSPGHTCYRFQNVLFAGDLFTSTRNLPALMTGLFKLDHPKVIEALRKVDLKGVDWLCPAHGAPVSAAAALAALGRAAQENR